MKNFNLYIVLAAMLPSLAFADGMVVSNPWTDPTVAAEKPDSNDVASVRNNERQSVAEPMMPFTDTRLVLFHFDPDLTYGVKTKDGLYTHIEVAKGDVIKGFYLSDSLRWKFHISGDKRRLFIKPTVSGQFTAATLVTAMRVYEMTFTSIKGSEDWYQRVTWSYPTEDKSQPGDATGIYEDELLHDGSGDAAGAASNSATMRVGPQFDEVMPVGTVDPKNMSFDYTITGQGLFKPVTVFDDGRFTWLRFDKKMQDMPALFLLNAEGKTEVLNYTTQGDYILISRLTQGILLRLGNQEVRIVKAAKSCGIFGC